MAKVTVTFDAWKEGQVAATQHEIPIVLPKRVDIRIESVSPKLVRELIHPNRTATLTDVRFSPSGDRLIAGDYPGGIVVVWEANTGKRLSTIETGAGYRGTLPYVIVTPDWKTLFVTQAGKNSFQRVEQNGKVLRRRECDGYVRAWNLMTGVLQKTYQHDPPRMIHGIRLSPDGNQFITFDRLPGVGDQGAVCLWNANTGKHLDLPENSEYYGVFSPDCKSLANVTNGKDSYATAISMFDTATGKEKWLIPVKEKNAVVRVCDYSTNGKWLVVSSQQYEKPNDWKKHDYRVDLLAASSGRKVATLLTAKNASLAAHFAPDGEMLALSDWRAPEPKLSLVSVTEKRVRKTLVLQKEAKGQTFIVSSPAFSPDGKRIAIVTQMFSDTKDRDLDAMDVAQPRIHLIDVSAGEIRETLVAPQGFSRDVCFSPDSRTLAVGGHGRVLLFDVSPKQ